ncbi:MAG: glycosyl hydrolase family 65 protein [Ignavibacteriaceae bacterium]
METWKVIYDKWNSKEEPLREALCGLGNGYFLTRGASEESNDDGVHYPGTYLACGYNRLKSHISGKVIENEDLVNWPNWLYLNFRIENDNWFNLEQVNLLEYKQELDLHNGILKRYLRFKDAEERITSITSRRIVSMDNPHLAAIQWKFKPENWSGKIQVLSAIDGTVVNNGVKRYRELNKKHLQPIETGQDGEDSIYLHVKTTQSNIHMAQAARTNIINNLQRKPVSREIIQREGYIAHQLTFNCEKESTVQIEKLVSIFTSHDPAISEPVLEAKKTVVRTESFEAALQEHMNVWKDLWHRCDIVIEDDDEAQLILRLHIYHLLQTVSMNSIDLDIGVPARGWHGEAYRGHIFWDELYIFPFLNLRIPELTRSLLMYRYRRLNEARFAAKEAEFSGSMYPWQSGSNGREESQIIHLNPKSGEWDPDITHLQRHINSAVAYNIWQYYQATKDKEFLYFYGADMILEIARFWGSIAKFNPAKGRYEIKGVVGPDEFHTKYPDREEPGLDNNAYTNFMAAWILQTAIQILNIIDGDQRKALLEKLLIESEELAEWKDISRKIYLPIREDSIINQFDGYDKLKEFDWETYRKKYGDIQRLDRILKAENDTTNRYQVGKQADVLMIFYLFSSEEIEKVFKNLDYKFTPDIIPKNINYYRKRTSHGSTLSRLVYSWVLARSEREVSWHLFKEALKSDYKDIQGGTTSEGIHLGSMAGTVDMIQRCYTGIEIGYDYLCINPVLPGEIKSIKLRIRYRGHWIKLNITQKKLIINFETGWSDKVNICVKNQVYSFQQGDIREFDLA